MTRRSQGLLGPMLALSGASVRLGGRELGPFTLMISAGERLAILGPSGAGKSTLLKLMAGEHAPHQGDVIFCQHSLADWTLIDLSRRRAVLPQSHEVAFGLPVQLVIALGRVAREIDPGLDEIVHESARMACATHLLTRRFDTLSGGEKARVQMARLFAQLWDVRHGLLLVDEPLAALDPCLQFELMDALQDYAEARGHAVVAVLHDINQALQGFERLLLIREGALVGDVPSAFGVIPQLEALYGVALNVARGPDGDVLVAPARRRPGTRALA